MSCVIDCGEQTDMAMAGDYANDIGAFIRRVRLQRGWSQEELGERSGVDWQYIGKVERGKIRQPGDEHLFAIAEALDIPRAEIRKHQGWVVAEGYRSAKEEGVVYDSPQVRRLDVQSREGESTVPVLAAWLAGRDPETCFVVQARDDLIEGGVLRRQFVLFEPLNGEMPACGEVVAAQTKQGNWWMFIWHGQMDVEPIGRKLAAWDSTARR